MRGTKPVIGLSFAFAVAALAGLLIVAAVMSRFVDAFHGLLSWHGLPARVPAK